MVFHRRTLLMLVFITEGLRCCRKVMFSVVSVCHSVEREVVGGSLCDYCPWWHYMPPARLVNLGIRIRPQLGGWHTEMPSYNIDICVQLNFNATWNFNVWTIRNCVQKQLRKKQFLHPGCLLKVPVAQPRNWSTEINSREQTFGVIKQSNIPIKNGN